MTTADVASGVKRLAVAFMSQGFIEVKLYENESILTQIRCNLTGCEQLYTLFTGIRMLCVGHASLPIVKHLIS